MNWGRTMLGTRELLMVRKASFSPSGDHQWARCEPRISSEHKQTRTNASPVSTASLQRPVSTPDYKLHLTFHRFERVDNDLTDFPSKYLSNNSYFLTLSASPCCRSCVSLAKWTSTLALLLPSPSNIRQFETVRIWSECKWSGERTRSSQLIHQQEWFYNVAICLGPCLCRTDRRHITEFVYTAT